MSTVRYIQKVFSADETQATNSDGSANPSYQVDNLSSATQSGRQQVEVFRASEAITAGDAVCFDFAQTIIAEMFGAVKKLDSGAANTSVFCGIAAESAAADDFVKVVVAGLAPNANVATGVAKGDYLILSSTAGRIEKQDEVTLTVDGTGALATSGLSPVSQTVLAGGATQAVKCAIALEAESSNAADVWVIKSY
jgi:hypothetical protein